MMVPSLVDYLDELMVYCFAQTMVLIHVIVHYLVDMMVPSCVQYLFQLTAHCLVWEMVPSCAPDIVK